MAIQFRKRIKIIPGIRLNLSKRGISFSMGVKGAHVTIGKDRTTTSVGIPGTGIYDRRSITHRDSPQQISEPASESSLLVRVAFVVALIFGAWLLSQVG